MRGVTVISSSQPVGCRHGFVLLRSVLPLLLALATGIILSGCDLTSSKTEKSYIAGIDATASMKRSISSSLV